MLNNEIWGDIDNLPYEISSKGVVRRKEGSANYQANKACVQPYVSNKGYLCINLYKQSKVYKFQIHRLLAIAFIPNPLGLPVINHIDGNPLNNDLNNLEWCTQAENIKHAWNTGLCTNRHTNASVKRSSSTSKYKGVSWAASRNKWAVYITVDKKRIGLGRFTDEVEAAKAYDLYVNANNLQSKGYSTNFV